MGLSLDSKAFTINRRPRLLIVDDQPVNVHLIYAIFSSECELFMAPNAKKALKICSSLEPDLILLDVMMPGMDGLELCKILKQQSQTKMIPILFITALQSSEDETACWEAGGVDFVNKPINPVTLYNRVKSHLLLKFQTEFLRNQALIDGLTGVANRRFFDEQIELYFRQSRRTGAPLAVLMIDVDFFKKYNDQYGHQAGDECLQFLASALKAEMNRPLDFVARYGGEEFVCLLPNVDLRGATRVAEKMVTQIQEISIERLLSEVTISIGIALYPCEEIKTIQQLINQADKQLYRAKTLGRNRVCY